MLIMRREAVVFLVQTLMQPLFLLLVLGKVFSTIGAVPAGFATVLLPGTVALTVIVTGLQGPSVDLARDLAVTHEIEDRLLAPLPISLVLTEKFGLAVVRALIGGTLVFPLAFWMLGNGIEVRTDRLALLIVLMVLVALAGASLGLLIAVLAPVQLLPVIFALVFTPLIFTGCTLYSWSSLDKIHWFQVVTLFNPITYAAEGLRYAMIPPLNGQAPPTLAISWILLALSACTVTCLVVAIRLFYRRVIG
jgi:ABC-2 type transport system permease protein